MLVFQDHPLAITSRKLYQKREFSPVWGHLGPREALPAGVALMCPVHPRVGPDSQVEDQVMVPLLGDAVVEPHCGRSQGSQLQEGTLPSLVPLAAALQFLSH